MVRKVGVWVDHRKAVLVSLGEGVSVRTVQSGVGKRVRSQGGARSRTPYGPQDVAYEPRRDLRYAQHLNAYYDEVVSEVSGAETILVIGPGEAKTELSKRMERSGVASDRIRVEAADKLTEKQIVELVKNRFGYPTRETV